MEMCIVLHPGNKDEEIKFNDISKYHDTPDPLYNKNKRLLARD